MAEDVAHPDKAEDDHSSTFVTRWNSDGMVAPDPIARNSSIESIGTPVAELLKLAGELALSSKDVDTAGVNPAAGVKSPMPSTLGRPTAADAVDLAGLGSAGADAEPATAQAPGPPAEAAPAAEEERSVNVPTREAGGEEVSSLRGSARGEAHGGEPSDASSTQTSARTPSNRSSWRAALEREAATFKTDDNVSGLPMKSLVELAHMRQRSTPRESLLPQSSLKKATAKPGAAPSLAALLERPRSQSQPRSRAPSPALMAACRPKGTHQTTMLSRSGSSISV